MKNFTKATTGFILGLALAGCATTGSVQQGEASGIHKYLSKERFDGIRRDARMKEYPKAFKDSFNGRRILVSENDLYIENLDGTERARITNSPEIKKTWAFLTKDAKYVFFKTASDDFWTEEYFIKLLDGMTGNEKQIDDAEYDVYFQERFPDFYQKAVERAVRETQ